MFDKEHSYFEGRRFRIITIILIFAVYSLSFSQTLPNTITTGYYKLYKDGKYISKHSSLQKVNSKMDFLTILYEDSDIFYTYPDQTRTKGQLKVIDTIQAIRIKDLTGWTLKGWKDYSTLGTEATEYSMTYLPFYEYGVLKFKADSIYNWQSKYNFERIRTFGKVEHKQLNIPFQYMEVYFLKQSFTQTNIYVKITEKQIRITSWIDGVKNKEYIPGSSRLNENEIGYEFYFGVQNIEEGKEYDFKMEVENDKNEIIIYTTTLKI